MPGVDIQVVVEGLGPGGSTLAWLLASKDVSVAGFDIAKRYLKACGDATPSKAASGMLAEYFGSVIDEVSDFRILVDGKEVAQVSSTKAPIWYIVDKAGLVASLREAAESEGARLEYGRPVTKFSTAIRVDARGPYSRRGDSIIVYRVIARAEWPQSTALIDFQIGNAGLYWVFPAGDSRVNAGAGFAIPQTSVEALRAATLRYLSKHSRIGDIIDERAAPLTPLRPPKLYDSDRVYIGEAAGLVNALSGEGIRQAVESAMKLAEAIHSCGAHPQCSRRRYRTYARLLTIEASISKVLLRSVMSVNAETAAKALSSLPAAFWRLFLEGKLLRALARASLSPRALAASLPVILHALAR